MKSTEERFWAKVDKSGECWLWTGAVSGSSDTAIYGRFRIGRHLHQAHRVSYELSIGAVPEGMVLDHRDCVSTLCVRPDHLRPVTYKQNGENRRGAMSNSSSGVRGVRFHYGAWEARIRHHGRDVQVGTYKTREEAERAAVARRNELFTHNDRDRISEGHQQP